MNTERVWQGNWDGRDATMWTGSIRNLRKKIPNFKQIPFRMAKGINKYRDLIVREPISDTEVDLGYVEAITRQPVPIEAVRNGYRTRSLLMGYKLFEHQKMLDDVLEVLGNPRLSTLGKPHLESLEATLLLSIYGARMYIEFLLPHYKRDGYILKIACRNAVDKKYALTINLCVLPAGAIGDIPFDGFYHPHTQELIDGAISGFLPKALRYFFSGTWKTDEADSKDIEKIIRKELTPNQQKQILSRLNNEKQDRVNLLRFREILSQLFNEGRDIFRSDEHAVRLANLTRALNGLANEAETQQFSIPYRRPQKVFQKTP